MVVYEGTCGSCAGIAREDIPNPPKFMTHAVRCPKCGTKVLLIREAPPSVVVDFLANVALRVLKCPRCEKVVGYANLGNAMRVGKVFDSEDCARVHYATRSKRA